MIDFFRRDDTMIMFYKKSLRNQGSVLLICLCFLVFNFYMVLTHSSIMYGVALGVFVCNTWWILLFYFDIYSDYKLEKHRYKLIKELEDKHDFEKKIEYLDDKRKEYE